MGHESRIEPWSPHLTAFCFAGFGTDRLRRAKVMKTAGRENPNRRGNGSSNRAHGAEVQNRSCSIMWAGKQEKVRPLQECFFLTFLFIDEKLLKRHARQVSVWDSEYHNISRAPELALAVAYQSLRLGYDSPSVAESLGMRAPAVRQILSRFIKRAVRKTDTPSGRPKKVKS